MRSIPNAVRRGNIFHFRRAVPTDVRAILGRQELTRSLDTSDAGDARIRARQLYIVSETLFDTVRTLPTAMLTPEKLAKLVQTFYETVLLEENRARFRQGVISAEQRQKAIEHHAAVAAGCKDALARNDFRSMASTTDQMLSNAGMYGLFTEEELAHIRQSMLRAGIELAEAIKARYEGDFNYEPRDKLLKQVIEDVQAQPPARPASRVAPVASVASVAPAPPPAETVAPVPKVSKAPLFSEFAEKFRLQQRKEGSWRGQHTQQSRKTYELFVEVNGDRPIDQYRRPDAVLFKEKLSSLPAMYGHGAAYKGKSVDEIIAYCESLPAEKKPDLITQKTVKRHFSSLGTLWEYAVSLEIVETNIFRGFRFANTTPANQQREMWDEEDIKRLFASPIWAGCQSKGRRNQPGAEIIRDEKFWAPLISLFTGMRMEEVLQLHVEDFHSQQGIHFLYVNDEGCRQTKNSNATRRVPLHRELVNMGLVAHVEEMRRQGEVFIFPGQIRGGADEKFGHSYSKWFSYYRKQTGLYKVNKDFHSLRHSATTFLAYANVALPIIDALTGHSTPGETGRYIKRNFKLDVLKQAVDSMDFGVNWSHLYVGEENFSPTAKKRLKRA